jgi:citrate lyase beta subunit
VLPLVETVRGIARCEEIAGTNGVERLVFATLVFALDLDLASAARSSVSSCSSTSCAAIGLAMSCDGVLPSAVVLSHQR